VTSHLFWHSLFGDWARRECKRLMLAICAQQEGTLKDTHTRAPVRLTETLLGPYHSFFFSLLSSASFPFFHSSWSLMDNLYPTFCLTENPTCDSISLFASALDTFILMLSFDWSVSINSNSGVEGSLNSSW
jgi:hypothetical protein